MISFDREHLRLIWSMVETHCYVLKDLSDDAICLWLLKKIKDNVYLSHDEMNEIKAYILSRSHLIREVANTQGSFEQHSTTQFSNAYNSQGVKLPYDKAV